MRHQTNARCPAQTAGPASTIRTQCHVARRWFRCIAAADQLGRKLLRRVAMSRALWPWCNTATLTCLAHAPGSLAIVHSLPGPASLSETLGLPSQTRRTCKPDVSTPGLHAPIEGPGKTRRAARHKDWSAESGVATGQAGLAPSADYLGTSCGCERLGIARMPNCNRRELSAANNVHRKIDITPRKRKIKPIRNAPLGPPDFRPRRAVEDKLFGRRSGLRVASAAAKVCRTAGTLDRTQLWAVSWLPSVLQLCGCCTGAACVLAEAQWGPTMVPSPGCPFSGSTIPR